MNPAKLLRACAAIKRQRKIRVFQRIKLSEDANKAVLETLKTLEAVRFDVSYDGFVFKATRGEEPRCYWRFWVETGFGATNSRWSKSPKGTNIRVRIDPEIRFNPIGRNVRDLKKRLLETLAFMCVDKGIL